ncbi:MAG TPA: UDP-N-acetylglucosamine 2-epimerase (non-hydrolyzing), partial [Microbacteriaceae bacterium]|nr:UDP-N-acetylglucosamine 2-epimerase (non-hydrolyzing) [Microbacteriaceae bacterium]
GVEQETEVDYASLIRVLIVFGTRPEAIKMIPVIRALQNSKIFRPVVIATGQHSDMVQDLITRAGIRLDANLKVGAKHKDKAPSLNRIFARVLKGVDRIWEKQEIPEDFKSEGRRQPNNAQVCLVHGDTTSAAAAALAAFNLQIPVMHVEAGLRTSNIMEPFPEEGNRQLISRIASLHFAPTPVSKTNLIREGIDADRIIVTGNTAIDTLRWAVEENVSLKEELHAIKNEQSPLVLITAHRRENLGGGIERIAQAVAQLASEYPKTRFVLPMHPNPLVRKTLTSILCDSANVHLTEPLEYLEFVQLASTAKLIISDSGGIQEEAPSLGVPVLVTRDVTERVEGLQAGTLKLVGTDKDQIIAKAREVLNNEVDASNYHNINPYGDGKAAERITQTLAHIFCDAAPPQEFDSAHLKQSFLRFLDRDQPFKTAK